MSKIMSNGRVIYDREELTPLGTVLEFFDKKSIVHDDFYGLYELVCTMNGDARTPFNTIGEMIRCIPEIINAGEEVVIVLVDEKFFVLDWDADWDVDGLNKMLSFIGDYCVVDYD